MALLVDKMITDEFVADLRRDSLLPAVQSQWTHQRMLDVAYDEVLMFATLLSLADHSYYRESDSTTLVASQAAYDIPRYAMLGRIHLSQLLDTTGAISTLDRIDPTAQWLWKNTTAGHPVRMRIDGTQIVLDPAPSTADIVTWPTLQNYIYRRPSRLVRLTADTTANPARAATVSSVVTTTVTFTAAPPSDFTSTSVHDFYSGRAPFRRIGSAITATAQAGSTQSFALANAALLTAGDFVCLRDETCVVPVPSAECLPYLRALVIGRIAGTQGDQAMYTTAQNAMKAYIATLVPATTNRLQNNLTVASLHNSPYLRGLGRRNTMVRS